MSHTDLIGQLIAERFTDITDVYPTRAEFTSSISPRQLFANPREIKAAGISLNLICQAYGDNGLRDLIERGTHVQCLFLDPAVAAIRQREREEGFPAGHLSALTELNIQGLTSRVRDRLPDEHRERLSIGTYDETVRFNLTLVGGALCVAQPYMPQSRGVDSPTFIVRRRSAVAGLYPMFDQIFNSLWERRRQV